MLFPFRSSAIFRNRWIALLWAVGICLFASDIVDSLSGVTKSKTAPPDVVLNEPVRDEHAPLPPPPVPNGERIVR